MASTRAQCSPASSSRAESLSLAKPLAELSCPVDIDIADHNGADRRALHEFSYRYHANAAAAAKCQDFHQSSSTIRHLIHEAMLAIGTCRSVNPEG